MIITAKFDSQCKICGGAIHKGERVAWFRRWGVKHVGCDDRPGRGQSSARGEDAYLDEYYD